MQLKLYTGVQSTGSLYLPRNRLDVSRLQARYLRGLLTAKTGWPKHHVIQYVRLALVKTSLLEIRI